MTIALLITHGLIGVALLGAITHQAVSALRGRNASRSGSFVDRYSGVNQRTFTISVAVLYVIAVILGGVIYPSYRVDVRIPFEEMGLARDVGLFELKEHFGGIGFGILAPYVLSWRAENVDTSRGDRLALTLVLAFIVWFDFIVGHVLNNIRGLS